MSFKFIRDHADRWPVRLMCRTLEVSTSGYYAWRNRAESARACANRALLADVRRLHAEHHGRYGSPRMHAALRAEGGTASRGRVARLMRCHGIRALAGRRFRPCTTDSRHHLPIAPNLLNQEFVAPAPNRVWLADITYIATGEGWCPPWASDRWRPSWRTSPPCSTWRPAFAIDLGPVAANGSPSAGRCATTCAPSCRWPP
jgi:transposase InsO family protein